MWIKPEDFIPCKDNFVVRTIQDKTKKEDTQGIILETGDSKLQDRPNTGIIVSIGPDSNFEKGTQVYFEPNKGFDLKMIESNDNYILLYDNAIMGTLRTNKVEN